MQNNGPSHQALIRHRRQVSAVLVLALGVSVVSNVAAAEASVLARAVSAWPPVALLLVVDVMSRSPRPSGWLGRLTLAATLTVALVAGVASFMHMRSVALMAGESAVVAVLFPLTVDGLAVVCSASLVEIARRLSDSVPAVEVADVTVSSELLEGPVEGDAPDVPGRVSGSLVAAVVPEVAGPESGNSQAPLVLFGN